MYYKEFCGTIFYSEEDCIYYGKVLFIKDLVSYEGVTPEELKKSFESAVDEYIKVKGL